MTKADAKKYSYNSILCRVTNDDSFSCYQSEHSLWFGIESFLGMAANISCHFFSCGTIHGSIEEEGMTQHRRGGERENGSAGERTETTHKERERQKIGMGYHTVCTRRNTRDPKGGYSGAREKKGRGVDSSTFCTRRTDTHKDETKGRESSFRLHRCHNGSTKRMIHKEQGKLKQMGGDTSTHDERRNEKRMIHGGNWEMGVVFVE